MEKRMKGWVFWFLIFCLAFPLVYAETLNIGDYVVSVAQDSCFDIPYGCDNCTAVNVTVTFPNGSLIFSNAEMNSTDGFHYNYSFCNTSTLGRYWVTFHSIEDGLSPITDQEWISVTPNGFTLSEGNSLLYIGILFLLFFMFIVSVFGIFQVENYIGKFSLYWVSHLLFGIWCFSVWQVTDGFLIGFIGLASTFKILFFISMFAVLPMLILSLAWIFYIHTMGEDVRNMVDKGMGVEEAFKKSASRRYF